MLGLPKLLSLIPVMRGINNKVSELNALGPLARQRSAVHPIFGKDEHLGCLFFIFFCIPNLHMWVTSDEYVVVAPADKILSSNLERRAAELLMMSRATWTGVTCVWQMLLCWLFTDARKHKYWSRSYSTGLQMSHTHNEKLLFHIFPHLVGTNRPRIMLPW